VHAKNVGFLIFVTCSDELFQLKLFKIVREEVEEIADARVIAVA